MSGSRWGFADPVVERAKQICTYMCILMYAYVHI